jgi:hypothetical protein
MAIINHGMLFATSQVNINKFLCQISKELFQNLEERSNKWKWTKLVLIFYPLGPTVI